MDKQDIQIAITAIIKWRDKVTKEEGVKESPLFFSDTEKAIKELQKLRKLLEK